MTKANSSSKRKMLVISDSTSNVAIIRLGSNSCSSTSLANENESFIVHSLVLATYHRLNKSN